MNVNALAAGAAISNIGLAVDQNLLHSLIKRDQISLGSCLLTLGQQYIESDDMMDDFLNEAKDWVDLINKQYKTSASKEQLLRMIK